MKGRSLRVVYGGDAAAVISEHASGSLSVEYAVLPVPVPLSLSLPTGDRQSAALVENWPAGIVPATDPSTASSLPTAHPTAREVNTRRGPASAACSVQYPASHPRPGHAHTRLSHRTRTGRPPAAGASRKHTSRRPLDRAPRPQRSQNTLRPPGV